MPATKQSQAIALANKVLATMQVFQNLRATVDELVIQYNSIAPRDVWSVLPTAVVNADGTLGAADQSPNTAHAIDTRLTNGLSRTVASDALVNAVVLLEAYQAFLGNEAVATADRNSVIDPLCGG